MTDPSTRVDPCTRLTVTGTDGARLVGCGHGGQLLGWIPAGSDQDVLWTSSTARCGPGAAIRGGVPVVFPQFAGRGPLPKHGFARDRAWQVSTSSGVGGGDPGGGPAGFRAVLTDDAQTRELWPHGFRLELTAVAEGDTLTVQLLVANLGETRWQFTAALHSYLRVTHPDATVHGLAGLEAEDNPTDDLLTVPDQPLAALGTRDWAVRRVPGPVRLQDGPRSVELSTAGWEDRVIWNPGPGHGLADVEPGGEQRFVCVEPAVLRPVALLPRTGWRSVLTLRTGTGG